MTTKLSEVQEAKSEPDTVSEKTANAKAGKTAKAVNPEKGKQLNKSDTVSEEVKKR